MPILTFLDANVLFAAHRGNPNVRDRALALLSQPERHFIASPFLRLEVMPKAVYHRNTSEVDFYQAYFDNVRVWVNDVDSIVRLATEESERCGINAMDALHVAAAHLAEANVLVTIEGREKPIYRTSLVQVVCLEAPE